MNTAPLFCSLSSIRIAEFISNAAHSVCFAGPGIQIEPAHAMVGVARRLGHSMLTVCLDFDERVMRMGFGDLEAIKVLREANIVVSNARGLRSALVIVDDEGFIYTPTALYLEAENVQGDVVNALRLSSEQVDEARARLSPVAKEIAIELASTADEKQRLANLPVEVSSVQIDDEQFKVVEKKLQEAPPVKFDVARQVRVFEPYLQYVELSLSGAAIQRHRLTIPPNIQRLGGSKDIEGRIRTTFELIEKGSKLSSKPLEDELNQIRKDFTRLMGKGGRVILKAAKPHLEKRLGEFKNRLAAHKAKVETELQKYLDESRKQVVDYYLPMVIEAPPDSLVGQLITPKPSKEEARSWLDQELNRVFPKADALVKEMKLETFFKDVTYETLNRDDFLKSVEEAFPNIEWDKTYNEFKAAGESQPPTARG